MGEVLTKVSNSLSEFIINKYPVPQSEGKQIQLEDRFYGVHLNFKWNIERQNNIEGEKVRESLRCFRECQHYFDNISTLLWESF